MFPYTSSGSLYAGPCPNFPILNLTPSNISSNIIKKKLKPQTLITYLGLRFVWTREHDESLKVLKSLNNIGDPLADSCISEISSSMKRGDDFLEAVESYATSNPSSSCSKLLKFISEPPPFPVDLESISSGKKFFMSHLPISSLALLHLSLIGGFSSPSINKTLNSTKYLTNKNPTTVQLRLFETNKMITDAMLPSDGACGLSRKGMESITKVRLLHAFIRSKLSKKFPDIICINQTELIVTSLSFSLNVLLGIESLLEKRVDEKDEDDYVNLWCVISYYIGIQNADKLINTHSKCKILLQCLIIELVRPDGSSVIASKCVIESVRNNPPFRWKREMHGGVCWKVMGDELAHCLSIKKGGWSVNVRVWFLIRCLKLYMYLVTWNRDWFASFNGRIIEKVNKNIFGEEKIFNGNGAGNLGRKVERLEKLYDDEKEGRRKRRFKFWSLVGVCVSVIGIYKIKKT